ncbi:MAG TPA: tRNA 4-thiouridine(8) synthase ThiI, partial [Thermoanaerobacterales bacterium]|nr:tRNA 4-thiouridine(8) synthase ThiI [Thermoanaerobacterales bacterium]
ATSLPIIRPLITFDKEEIIDISNKIGTYNISTRPYEDCCTVFVPKHPKTRPSLDEVKLAEKNLDYEKLVENALNRIEIINIVNDGY